MLTQFQIGWILAESRDVYGTELPYTIPLKHQRQIVEGAFAYLEMRQSLNV